MVAKGLGHVFFSYQYIMIYSLFRCILYFSQIHNEVFSSVRDLFFRKGFHVNLVFFLYFHISYLFTKQSSRFIIVFLLHTFAQISNIAVLLLGLIIVIRHESIS